MEGGFEACEAMIRQELLTYIGAYLRQVCLTYSLYCLSLELLKYHMARINDYLLFGFFIG